MSVGGIIGGVVGGVVGFFIGGPYGAAVGASFGLGIGMMVDPLKPDVTSPGQPDLQEYQSTAADEGVPISDILGCTKVVGNIIWHGKDRAKAIYTTTTTEGGKSSSDTSTTYQSGWEYYSSWATGICLGPVNKLYTVFNGDDPVWNGEITLDTSASGNSVNGETITLAQGMGSMTFYFGTPDQVANSTMTNALNDSTLNPAYRNQCYAFFDDNLISKNSNRIPTMRFVVGKFPLVPWTDKETIGVYDYNPSCCVYYVFNTMMGIDAQYLNSTTFSGAAHTLWQEGLGISIHFNQHNSALTYLISITEHVKSIVKWSNDSKFHYKLLRKDTDIWDMEETDENIYLDKPVIDRIAWSDTTNEIKLSYVLRTFVDECVIDPPTLTLIGQTSSDDCEGEASFEVWLGCPPLTLQTRTGDGGWVNETIVDDEFTWMLTPDECFTTSVRIKDNEGQTSNTITLDRNCTCGSITLEATSTSLTCSQTIYITASGTIDGCCEYYLDIFSGGGSIEEGLTQTGPTAWTYRSPDGIGVGGACCLDDGAEFTLYCCDVPIDDLLITITGGPPLVYFPDNPSIVSYSSEHVIDVGWGTPPFHWKPPVQDVFTWRYTDTYNRYNWIEVGDGQGDICGVSTQLIITDACQNTAWGTITVPADVSDIEYDTGYSASTMGRNTNVNVGITDSVSTLTYTWTVVGDGFWINAAHNSKTIDTTAKQIKIYTDGTACGYATITITSCGGVNEAEGNIRCTFGSWRWCGQGTDHIPGGVPGCWCYGQGPIYASTDDISDALPADDGTKTHKFLFNGSCDKGCNIGYNPDNYNVTCNHNGVSYNVGDVQKWNQTSGPWQFDCFQVYSRSVWHKMIIYYWGC